MKVNLIKWVNIEAYTRKNPASVQSFLNWHILIKKADWKTIHDLKKTFPTADLIGNNRLIFDIGGNNYRMICKYHFGEKSVRLFVKWLGTHTEYTRLCKEGKQYTVGDY